jgi:hypothetical protein
MDDVLSRCACGSVNRERPRGGDEPRIKSMEIQEPAAVSTAPGPQLPTWSQAKRIPSARTSITLTVHAYACMSISRWTTADYARRVNPDIELLQLSATTGEGLDGWYSCLRARLAAGSFETVS